MIMNRQNVLLASMILMATAPTVSGKNTALQTIGMFIDSNYWAWWMPDPVHHTPIFGSQWPSKEGTQFNAFDGYAGDQTPMTEARAHAHEYKMKSATVWEQLLDAKDISGSITNVLHPVMVAIEMACSIFNPTVAAAAREVDGLLSNLNTKLKHWFLICTFEREGVKPLYVKVQRNFDGIRAECVTSADAPLQDNVWKPTPVAGYKDKHAMDYHGWATLADVLSLCQSQAKNDVRYNVLCRNCQHFVKYVYDKTVSGPAIVIPMDKDL